MKSRVLNAWSKKGRDPDGTEVSVVSLEATAVPNRINIQGPFPTPSGDYLTKVVLEGVGLTMAEDEILVADGLVRKFAVLRNTADDIVAVQVYSEFETLAHASVIQGMPQRVDVTLSRSPLLALLSGRHIAVDPGHGGKEHGIRGPVNLLEKDCALAVALELEALLKSAGAVPLMTRDDDSYLAPGFRLADVAAMAPELAVEIHMAGEKDPLARSYHVRALQGCERSAALAASISEALKERMGTIFSGVEEMRPERAWGFPVARIEPVCLTYFADEANFRAPLFRKRLAQGIFNGIARFLRSLAGEEDGGDG